MSRAKASSPKSNKSAQSTKRSKAPKAVKAVKGAAKVTKRASKKPSKARKATQEDLPVQFIEQGLCADGQATHLDWSKVVEIPINRIRFNRFLHEIDTINLDKTEILKDSIGYLGLLDGFIVRPLKRDKKGRQFYELLTRKNRLTAYAALGNKTAPCLVVDMSDEKMLKGDFADNHPLLYRQSSITITAKVVQAIIFLKKNPAQLLSLIVKDAQSPERALGKLQEMSSEEGGLHVPMRAVQAFYGLSLAQAREAFGNIRYLEGQGLRTEMLGKLSTQELRELLADKPKKPRDKSSKGGKDPEQKGAAAGGKDTKQGPETVKSEAASPVKQLLEVVRDCRSRLIAVIKAARRAEYDDIDTAARLIAQMNYIGEAWYTKQGHSIEHMRGLAGAKARTLCDKHDLDV